MRLIENWKTKWTQASALTRALTLLHLVLCATVLTMAVLVILSVVDSLALFYPLGCMELTSAYLFRRKNPSSARICLICGVFLLLCSTAILVIQLLGA